MGPPRHLQLLGECKAQMLEWPVPFATGLSLLLKLRRQKVVVLASGDPFWFGAGSAIARELEPGEWRAFPGVSTFSLAAARLGWPLEATPCLGLHAAPLERLRPILAPGARAIVLLRDGSAVGDLAIWLQSLGFGASEMHVMQALGGPREDVRRVTAEAYDLTYVSHPVCVALEVAGDGVVLSRASGQVDDVFAHDGQITKRPVRALTLSTLAPRPGEMLWDIGAGSGSIALEWLLSDPSTQAIAIEARVDRAANIETNALSLGQDRLQVVVGEAPGALDGLATPDAVFIGGGLNTTLLNWLESELPKGTRLVANAVTLDSEAVLIGAHARLGGELLKLEVAEAAPLGRFRGWKASYPITQWSVTL